ncbi:MAG: CocE/NonD family hydrolase [Pseudomonadota bacterium]
MRQSHIKTTSCEPFLVFVFLILVLSLPSLLLSTATAEENTLPLEDRFTRQNVMIPMRDGIKLYTEVYTPTDTTEKLPILLLRTPYGVSDKDGGYTLYFKSLFHELSKEGYIIVVQDVRGRFKSEGDFVFARPLAHRKDPDAVDASTDAYDAIDWLVNNTENNGRVGMLGISYAGWYTAMASIDPHPALKAASPQASPSDFFINDDFFHNGAFRLSNSTEFPYLIEYTKDQNSVFPYDQIDLFEFFLDLGPISNLNKLYLKDKAPTWNDFLTHSTYDEYWKAQNLLQHFDEISVPSLHVIGWWDPENLGGALDLYAKTESVDSENHNSIVVGPWYHGQWSKPDQTKVGNYEFGSNTSEYYQNKIQSPWFAYWLKDEGDLSFLSEAIMYQSGSDEWKAYDQWPPLKQTTATNYYLQTNGKLTTTKPKDSNAFADYISDPKNPVPYSPRPIMSFYSDFSDHPISEGKGKTSDELDAIDTFKRETRRWKLEDQRFSAHRPDVLTFETPVLKRDVEVTGQILFNFFGSTTGEDTDWIVKLIDVYPEKYSEDQTLGGYQLMIADDVIRSKFRDSFETPKPLVPGEVTEFTIDLRTRNHLFRKGHKIMIQVQSSWFPLIDLNPQTFVNIPDATEADFKKAENRIYFDKTRPSHIVLPVVK